MRLFAQEKFETKHCDDCGAELVFEYGLAWCSNPRCEARDADPEEELNFDD